MLGKSGKVLKQLRDTGYCIIPGYLSTEECHRLTKHIDVCMSENQNKIQRDFKEGLGGDYRLFGLEGTDETIYNSLYKNKYFDILKTYSRNPEITPCTVLAGILRSDPNLEKVNSGGGWHRDPGTQYGTKVKTIIYLTDVDSTSGPFTIIPNSKESDVGVGIVREDCPEVHKNLRIYDSFVAELEKQGKKPVEVLGKAGLLVLVDVGNIHMGKPIEPTSSARYTLTNYFAFNQKGSDSFKRRNKDHSVQVKTGVRK